MKITNYKFDQIPHHIGLVKDSAEKLQNKIHALAVSILSEWARNPKKGQECAKLMTSLQEASPYHRKAFADWVGLMTTMQWSEDTETWYVHEGQKFAKSDLDLAKAKPFWSVSPPPKANPINLMEELEKILNKVEKHMKKPLADDVIDTVAVRELRSIRQGMVDRAEEKDTVERAKS